MSTIWQPETGRPTIVIYDGYPGGAGIAELGFAAGRRHLEATLDVISSLLLRRRVPQLRAVAQVRQRQRAARPRRRRGAAAQHAHDGPSTNTVSVSVSAVAPIALPTIGNRAGVMRTVTVA